MCSRLGLRIRQTPMSVPAVPPTSCVDTSHVASLSCHSLEFTAEEASRPEAPVRGAMRSQEAPGSLSGARLESTACEQPSFPLLAFLCDSLSLPVSLQPSPLVVVGAARWLSRPALVRANLRHRTGGIAHISTGSSCLPGPQPCLPPSLPPRACGAALILAFGSWISPTSLHGPPPTPSVWLGFNSQPWCWLLFPARDAPHHPPSPVASGEQRVNHSLPPLGVSTAMSF